MSSPSGTKKRQLQCQSTTDMPNKRSGAHLAPTPTSSTTRPLPSGWLDLPAELVVCVTRFLPRFALVLSSVHRRLYALIRGSSEGWPPIVSGATSASSSSSSSGSSAHVAFWRDMPLATVIVDELCALVEVEVEQRRVQLFAREDPSSVPSVLASLRDVPVCRFVVMASRGPPIISRPVLLTCLHALRSFAQLTSLSLELERNPRHGRPVAPDPVLDALATSLHSLHQLRSLQVYTGSVAVISGLWSTNKALRAVLRRLCREQIEHIGLPDAWLRELTRHDKHSRAAAPPMPRVRSFEYTGTCGWDHQGRDKAAVDLLAVFPSLTHADLPYHNDKLILLRPTLPRVATLRLNLDWLDVRDSSAYTVPAAHSSSQQAALLAHPLQTLCVLDRWPREWKLEQMRRLLSLTPHLRQFAVTDRAGDDRELPIPYGPQMLTALQPLTNLTYLQIDTSVEARDLRCLLTPASPPAFAASLRQLALVCRVQSRRAIAKLLPSLPSMYPALTHCHIGAAKAMSMWSASSERWDAAVQVLKTALGPAWCESKADVVAWRADVMWRRELRVQQLKQ